MDYKKFKCSNVEINCAGGWMALCGARPLSYPNPLCRSFFLFWKCNVPFETVIDRSTFLHSYNHTILIHKSLWCLSLFLWVLFNPEKLLGQLSYKYNFCIWNWCMRLFYLKNPLEMYHNAYKSSKATDIEMRSILIYK